MHYMFLHLVSHPFLYSHFIYFVATIFQTFNIMVCIYIRRLSIWSRTLYRAEEVDVLRNKGHEVWWEFWSNVQESGKLFLGHGQEKTQKKLAFFFSPMTLWLLTSLYAIQRCYIICETISSGREVMKKILKFNIVKERARAQVQSLSAPWKYMTRREGWEVVFQGKLPVRGLRIAHFGLVGRTRHSKRWTRSQNSAISKSGAESFPLCCDLSWPTHWGFLPYLLSSSFSAKSHPLSFKHSQSTNSL